MISIILILLLILLIGLFNLFFPVTFTGYFILCSLTLVVVGYIAYKNIASRIRSWAYPLVFITFCSLLVTRNYLYPPQQVYSNVNHHAIKWKGLRFAGNVPLVNAKNHPRAVWDKPEIPGELTLKITNEALCLEFNQLTAPLFAETEKDRKLLNKQNLIPLSGDFEITFTNGYRLAAQVIEKKGKKRWRNSERDSMFITIKAYNNKDSIVTEGVSSFHRILKKGYPLPDLLQAGINYPAALTDNLNMLDEMLLVRERETGETDFYVSLPPESQKLIKGFQTGSKTYTYSLLKGKGEYILTGNESFYVGIGLNSTESYRAGIDENNQIVLHLTQPRHFYLPEEESDQSTIIVSSSTRPLIYTRSNSAILFPIFEEAGNINQMSAHISYRKGPTQQPMDFRIVSMEGTENFQDHKKETPYTPANTEFHIATKGGVSEWIFEIEDFRSTSLLQPIEIFIVLLILALMAAVSIALPLSKSYSAAYGYTILWIFLIPLFTMRMYLLWRISVFPPVEEIGINAFETLRMKECSLWNIKEWNMKVWTYVCTFLLFAGMLVTGFIGKKMSIQKKEEAYGHVVPKIACYAGKVSILLILLYAVACGIMAANTYIARLVNILLPVALFFFWEYKLQKAGKQCKENETLYNKTLVNRALNGLLATGAMFFGDPGYAIMFFLFILTYMVYQLITFRSIIREQADNREKVSESKKMLFWKSRRNILWIAMAIIIFIIGGPYLATFAFNYPLTTSIVVAALLVILPAYYFFVVFRGGNERFYKIWMVGFLVIAGFVIIEGPGVLLKNPHMKYRALIHMEPISQIMMKEEAESRDHERLLEAAQNQWYLQYQLLKGQERNLEPGIIKLAPHFKKGVSWTTQISDIIISRYVIGELSAWVAFSLLIFFLTFVFAAMNLKIDSTIGKGIVVGIASLLFMQATFVWLASTNRFIFFGQDFPFLSQNSKLTLLFVVFLLIGMGYFISRFCYINTPAENMPTRQARRFEHSNSWGFLIGMFIILVVTTRTNNHYYSETRNSNFNVAGTIENSKSELDFINQKLSLFIEEEKEERNRRENRNNRSKYAYLRDNFIPDNLQEVMLRFDERYNMQKELKELVENGKISEFTYSLYKLYLEKFSRKNNIQDIIHLRRPYGSGYELAINNDYFLLTSPDDEKLSWKGNIYPSESVSGSIVQVNRNDKKTGVRKGKTETITQGSKSYRTDAQGGIADKGRFFLRKLDEAWTPPGETSYIAGINSYPSLVKGSDGLYEARHINDLYGTIRVFEEDYINIFPSGNQDDMTIYLTGADGRYLARNIQVNGKQRLLYPLEHKLYWIHPFGNLTKSILSGNEESREQHTNLSLDYDLSEKIYNRLAEISKNSKAHAISVVALDGNGKIRVMSDKKNSSYGVKELNPNHSSEIAEWQERFYLLPNIQKEQRFFSNLNLKYMEIGPGSTLKPIMYAAVTSHIHLPWSSFKMYVPGSEAGVTHEGAYLYANYYAGQNISESFKSIANDENYSDSKIVDPVYYLYKSSNYYNSLMVYIGSFTYEYVKNQYRDYKNNPANGSTLFKPLKKVTNKEWKFPQFAFEGGEKLVFGRWLYEPGDSYDGSTIMNNGLSRNFGLWSTQGETTDLRNQQEKSLYFYEKTKDDKKDNSHKKYNPYNLWANPATSHLLEEDRTMSEHMISQTLKGTTLGAYPVMVTPLKMAEMYGRLSTLNASFKASVNELANPVTGKWISSSDWHEDDLLKFYAENLFMGMKEAVNKGTANSVVGPLSKEFPDLHFYAKTGTINITDTKRADDKLLAVIISKNALHTAEGLKNNIQDKKVYVLYFNYVQSGGLPGATRNIIRDVIQSKAFRNYMDF